jgi:hypothetical protein
LKRPSKTRKPPRQRPHYEEKLRPYRIDKHRPKRPVVIFREDVGNFERVRTISFPKDIYEKETVIPKNPNPSLFTIIKAPVRIIYYLDSNKCFIYDNDKNYLGNFERHDLKRLFSAIGGVLRRTAK